MIPVTKTFLPPIEEYTKNLQKAWDNNWITNRGVLTLELEDKIRIDLSLNHVLLTTNGTLPIQIAIKALGLKGEIITTPFSYIATASSIIWENCKPVFVDIHPDFFTIDEEKIETAITKETTGIIATHVFGNPCNIEIIEKIAHKHQLKVIYDAAHCFGVEYKGQSIFKFGDVSTCSFHATKVFHTGEGGALICNDSKLFDTLYYHHNFGHNGPEKFHGLGINAKMSELQAAMGLSVYPYFKQILASRKEIVDFYKFNLDWSKLKTIQLRDETVWNYSYFPILFESEERLENCLKALKQSEIFPRRYFYPSLNTVDYISGTSMPISESIASRVICLPLYVGLEIIQLKLIVNIINTIL